jgi:hypothetical protein
MDTRTPTRLWCLFSSVSVLLDLDLLRGGALDLLGCCFPLPPPHSLSLGHPRRPRGLHEDLIVAFLCPTYARPYYQKLRQYSSPPPSHSNISCCHRSNPLLMHSETPFMSLGEKFKDFGDDFEIDIFCNYLS